MSSCRIIVFLERPGQEDVQIGSVELLLSNLLVQHTDQPSGKSSFAACYIMEIEY